MKFQLGEQVGDYIVTGFLGSGATGEVFRVEHAVTRRVEAIKVLLREVAGDHASSERFLREAKVLARLDHPNITAIHNAFWHDDDFILVMEYVEGESLRRIIDRGPVPYALADSYARQILRALSHAHSRGVIHRDVSPSNILVTPDGHIKLTDFGLARAPQDLRVTVTGAMLGSLHYSAPEQIRSSPVLDARADLYSCAAVCYELFTGTRVFEAGSAFDLMLAHTERKPTPPREMAGSLPKRWNSAIMRALEKDAEKRFPSADEFLDAVDPNANSGLSHVFSAAVGLLLTALVLLGLEVYQRMQPPPQAAAGTVAAEPVSAPVIPPAGARSEKAGSPSAPAPTPQPELAKPEPPAGERTPMTPSSTKSKAAAGTKFPVKKRLPNASIRSGKLPPVAARVAGDPPDIGPAGEGSAGEGSIGTNSDSTAGGESGPQAQPSGSDGKLDQQEATAENKPGLLRKIGRRLNPFRKKPQASAPTGTRPIN